VSIRVPVLRGALRGRWWSPLSGGKFGRVVGGSYEPDLTELFVRLVRPGSVIFDIGAHIGYYSLLAAMLSGPRGRVVAFEPNPRNLRFLRQHVRMNRLSTVDVLPVAVSDREGEAAFERGTGSGTGRLAATGSLQVTTTTVDAAAAKLGVAPGFLKIDVEGAEAKLLAGAIETIRLSRPVIFLSTHGPRVHAESQEILGSAGYHFERIGADPVVSELLCVPAELADAVAW
jgi:FkbM family methyltransferase